MSYQPPVSLVLSSLVLGLVLVANDVHEKVWNKFFPPAAVLAEAYPFLSIKNIYAGDPSDLSKNRFNELTKQLPTHKVAATEHAFTAFDASSQTQALEFFCDAFSNQQNIPAKFSERCKADGFVYQQLANYSLTNTNNFSISDITVTFQKYSVDTFGVETLEVFIDQPEHENGCLKAFPSLHPVDSKERPCFASVDGSPFQVTFSQPLLPGETLIIPIYVAYIAQFQSEEFGNNYTGIIKSGFWLPQSVSVDGRTSIERSRPMAPSPIFSLGEFEIRG